MNQTREVFIENWDYIDDHDLTNFLSGIHKELRERNPLWVKNLYQIAKITVDLVNLALEKQIKNRPDIV
jgi:hypothetical protein